MSGMGEYRESDFRICLDGPVTLASAAEMKERLLAGLFTANGLELNLERATEIDIAGLQLLWAAAREAKRNGVAIVCRVSGVVADAARDAGFPPLPGRADES